MSSPYEFVYRGAFSFPLSPRQMWQELERPDRLTGRWRWVDVRRVDPTLEQGAELTCVIKQPVPLRMLLDVISRKVTHGELIGVEFRGDLRGRGELRLEPDSEGTLADCGGASRSCSAECARRHARLTVELTLQGGIIGDGFDKGDHANPEHPSPVSSLIGSPNVPGNRMFVG
jgi:hypothetical protein